MAAMEEQQPSSTPTRLYVGGLGEKVTENDLRNTFSNLGSLQSIDIIRAKGRSFAYINFLPSSLNSLPKLFSTYNGCSWKGGKLKLERAKEHYIDRLKREWAEDAESENSDINHGDIDTNMVASTEPKSPIDLENMQFRLFFPKLRKLKSLPLRGTGKHKYSFQRVPVPSLPTLFCDCPEHSNPVPTPKVARAHPGSVLKPKVAPDDDSDAHHAGIDEAEFDMMNSVINRLLGHESEVKDSEVQDGCVTEEEINVMNFALNMVVQKETSSGIELQGLHTSPKQTVSTSEDQEENYIEDETDDDDIKINAVSGRTYGSFSSWTLEQQRSLTNQTARLNQMQNHGDLDNQSRSGVLNENLKSFNKKRKTFSSETNEDDSSLLTQLKKSEEATGKTLTEPHNQKSTERSTVSEKATPSSSSKRKTSWTQLIGGGNSSSFSISQIL